MTDTIDLEAALALNPKRRSSRGGSSARKVELARRRATAANLAVQALRNLHREEVNALYQQALIKVDAERGPLPE